jgi:hypothetical protein
MAAAENSALSEKLWLIKANFIQVFFGEFQ